jgi:DhnA family fructose-bisphosphate aldolase class Ia
MHRIFRSDGRTLIVAMDHAGFMNKPLPGLIDAAKTIRECVASGADAIMTTLGTARAQQDAIAEAGLILTISANERPAIDQAVNTALTLGADALKVLVFPFEHDPEPTVQNLTWLGAQCLTWGMPLLAETIPGGWRAGAEMRTPEILSAAARIGAESGADLIKTFTTADPAQFATIAGNCPVPVVILGGEKGASDRELLQMVKDHLDHGAAGAALGRNLWGHPQPGRLTAALTALIHHNARVDDALRELDG